MTGGVVAGRQRASVARDNFIRFYQWDRFPRARTALSIALALPAIAQWLRRSQVRWR